MPGLLARIFGGRRDGGRRYVVACDFSLKTLAALDEPEIAGINAFFSVIEPFSDEEIDLWDGYAVLRNLEVLREWSLKCLNNRGGSRRLELFFAPDLDDGVQARLASWKWVRTLKRMDKDLFDLHIEVLKGLDEYLRVAQELGKELWQVTAISLGPYPPYEFDPDEPMNIATRRAADKGVTVIVAAGNEGRIIQGNSLNPWSVAPWVIGVGATNAEGTRLLDLSSRGLATQPYKAPTVVAPGVTETLSDGLNHGEKVAIENIRQAPPNSVNLAPIGGKTWRFTKDGQGKISMALIQDGKTSEDLPLEQVLEMFRAHRKAKTKTESGTSFAAEYVSSLCTRLAKAAKPLVKELPPQDRPTLLKGLLMDMAKPLAGTKAWETGSGVVTTEIADQYIRALDAARIARVLEAARRPG